MSGRVCEKHQEYAADGVCRWCEPERDPDMTLLDYARAVGDPPLFLVDLPYDPTKTPIGKPVQWTRSTCACKRFAVMGPFQSFVFTDGTEHSSLRCDANQSMLDRLKALFPSVKP